MADYKVPIVVAAGLSASLPVFTDGNKSLVSKSVVDARAALGLGALVLPFFNAAGTLDAIPLTAEQKLPFFDSAGVAKNITLTT